MVFKKKTFKRTYKKRKGFVSRIRRRMPTYNMKDNRGYVSYKQMYGVNNNKNVCDPFPEVKMVHLRYSHTGTLTSGALGVINSHRFRLLSLFDPDETYAGHQPYGHDVLAAIYKNYLVVGFSYVFKAFNPAHEGTYIGTYVANNYNYDNPVGEDFTIFREKGNCKYKILSKVEGKPVTISGKVGIAKLLNMTKQGLWDARTTTLYSASFGATPSYPAWADFVIGNINAENNTTVNYTLNIVYHAIVFDHVPMGQS